MGAGAAVLAAARRPGLVSGLMLVGPFVRNAKASAMRRLVLRAAMAPPWAAISWKSYLPKLYAGQRPPDFGEYRDQVITSMRRPGYAKAFSRTTRTSHDPAQARLADVTAPALVMMGEQDPDFPDPRAEADWIARALHAQVVMVPQAGHYPQSQRPDITTGAVLRFLESVIPVLGAGPAGAAGTSGAVPAVAWHRCPAGSAGAMAGGFLCATVAAPLDYRDRSGPKISLAVVEHAATGPARRGVIFFNPGGPGGARHGATPGMDRVLPEGTAPRLRHRQLGPARVRGEHGCPVLREPGRGKRVPRQVRPLPRGPGPAARLHPPLARVRQDLRRAKRRAAPARLDRGLRPRPGPAAPGARPAQAGLPGPLLRHVPGRHLRQPVPPPGGPAGAGWECPAPGLDQRRAAEPALGTYLRMGSDKAAVKALDAFLRICGQRSIQACAFSAGSPAATGAKWNALLARLRRAPITLGGTAFTYAEIVTDIASTLPFVQPHTTPVTGGSIPGWPPAAQGLQELWMARNATTAARPGTPPAAMAAADQPYGGAEQGYAVQCNEAPSPPPVPTPACSAWCCAAAA
jgi:hypothetical protein